jgi:prepilin-type N-terminal cleavage/methylation domain-containing protein
MISLNPGKTLTTLFKKCTGFTLVELSITVAVVSVAFSSLILLNGRLSNMLRSANDCTLVNQTLQERMEMLRSANWNTLTSEETPDADMDVSSDDATDESTDPSNEVLTDTTEFPDDLPDSSGDEPGLLTLLDKVCSSAAGINNLTETITVTKYPEGSTAIKVRRNPDGSLTTLSHNPNLANEAMVRVVVQLTWVNSADNRTRNQSGQIILTKSSQ